MVCNYVPSFCCHTKQGEILGIFYNLWVFLETRNSMKLREFQQTEMTRVHLKPRRTDRRLHTVCLQISVAWNPAHSDD